MLLSDRLGPVNFVAGVDVGFPRPDCARAAVVVLRYPDLTLCEQVVIEQQVDFPYRTGLLAYRELPAVLAAVARLSTQPNLFLCDGQGTAHPRRFGIACHLGVLLDCAAIGVGKTRLSGRYQQLGEQRGARAPLMVADEQVGYALRSRQGCNPLYVSAGHRISQESAAEWVMRCCRQFKLPETTRCAHRLASG